MARHAAFMRGLNLGRRRLTNDELRAAVAGAGFTDVQTFIASGNVVFDGKAAPADEETALEAHLADALGYEVDTFVRTLDDVASVADHDPFDDPDPVAKIHVMFFKDDVGAGAAAALDALGNSDDRFAVGGREVYWFRRGGLTQTTIDLKALDRATGKRTNTMRTLNTLRRMVAKFG